MEISVQFPAEAVYEIGGGRRGKLAWLSITTFISRLREIRDERSAHPEARGASD